MVAVQHRLCIYSPYYNSPRTLLCPFPCLICPVSGDCQVTLASVGPFSAVNFPKHWMLRSYNFHLLCDLDQKESRLSTSLIAVIESRLFPSQGSSSVKENAQLQSHLEVTNHQHFQDLEEWHLCPWRVGWLMQHPPQHHLKDLKEVCREDGRDP